MLKKLVYYPAGIFLISALLFGTTGCQPERLRVATTTSLYDTGLWDELEPLFEEQYNTELDIMYAGTGKALELGRRGDVDVVTVHSKAREEEFIANGYGIERVPFAYNYFLIVGPESDPAGIKGMSPEDAFRTLYESKKESFISRGDDSGTHTKEKAIWTAAGFDYESVRTAGDWYVEAGSGMGPTLMMANEKLAYTLTDMGTFLSYKHRVDLELLIDEEKLNLVPIVSSGDILLNIYSAIAVNPENVAESKIKMADNLIAFLISPEVQEIIGRYKVEDYGTQLFVPYAGEEIK